MQFYPNATPVVQQAAEDPTCERWIRDWLRQNLGIVWPCDISVMHLAVALLLFGGMAFLVCLLLFKEYKRSARRNGDLGEKSNKDGSGQKILENVNSELLQQIKQNQSLRRRFEELELEHERVKRKFYQYMEERDAELEMCRIENQQLQQELDLIHAASNSKNCAHESDSERNDPYVSKCLEDVDAVVQSTRMLEKDAREFRGSRNDKVYLHLKELLIRNTIKLDNIESEGHARVREERKRALQYVHQCISILEGNSGK